MRFSFVLILFMLLSSSVYAQNDPTSPKNKKPNIMEGILFLNANQANNGSASFKADPDKNTLEYFDQDGRLMEKSWINENNDIVSQEYNKNGKVISESKITEAFILARMQELQDDYKNKEVPEMRSKLSIMARAAERYAQNHAGHFPKQMKDLVTANPPYLTKCFCDDENPTYRIVCDINETGYKFKANSLWPHLESYVMTNGEKLATVPPHRPAYEKSTSTCK